MVPSSDTPRQPRYADTSKRRILVCGYPKSGNTWLTRLVAELVGCPVSGLWMAPRHASEWAIEGQARVSDYECFKAHHAYRHLLNSCDREGNGTERAIYICRDPRDVVVSAANYFTFRERPHLHALLSRLPGGLRAYYALYEREPYRLARALEVLLHGGERTAWLHVPWRAHVESYRASDVLFLRYEDLLADAPGCARRILDYLGLQRSDTEIATAIANQSFATKKQTLAASGDLSRANFLRSGRSGQGRAKLSPAQLQQLQTDLGDLMQTLSYR